jgi:hypothetical protein
MHYGGTLAVVTSFACSLAAAYSFPRKRESSSIGL